MYDQIRYEVTEPVAIITLSRPEAMNAWTDEMEGEFRDAVARAEADPLVVGIVITGDGRAFCAGADMNMLSSLSSGGDGGGIAAPPPPGGDDFSGKYTFLMKSPKPVIAAINGAVAGMAFPLVLACDLRFMAPDAVLLTAFAQRGLIAEWGLSWMLPRLVGPAVTLDLLFSSRKVGGEEALRLGLVNGVVPAEALVAHCVGYVRELAAKCSPTSLSIMKRQVYQQLHVGLGAAHDDAVRLMVESFGRPDFAEGVRSFLEKRPPNFGRLGA